MSTQTYLITIEQVKQLTVVTANVDATTIQPHLLTTQLLKVMPLLGKQLMDQLLTEIATQRTVSAATQANPVVVTTSAAHGYTTGDSINIVNATGMVGINGQWDITVLSPTTFELDGLDGTAFPAYNVGTATAVNMIEVDVTLMPYVLNVAAWHVLAYAVPFIWATISNSGIITHGMNTNSIGNVGNPVGASDMKWYKQNCENTANAHEQILYEFMNTNKADYPLWQPVCTFTALGNCATSSNLTGMNGPVGRKNSGLNFRFP